MKAAAIVLSIVLSGCTKEPPAYGFAVTLKNGDVWVEGCETPCEPITQEEAQKRAEDSHLQYMLDRHNPKPPSAR